MSRRMLSSFGFEGKQTLADDLESLVYVVLYCALLWLPHDLSQDDLQAAMKGIFELSRWHPVRKAFVGGDGKIGLALQHDYIKHANFPAPFQRWLDSVLDHMIPVGGGHSGPRRDTSQWSADQLDTFWADILQTETLEQNDRVVRDYPRALGDYEPQTGLESTEAIVLGKRASKERDLDEPEPDKKAKRPRGKKLAAEAPKPSASLGLPRRSLRLAAKAKQGPQLPIVAKHAPKERVASNPRRTGKKGRGQ
ncbi:hypothetical protein BD309DRAFT_958321 [Dichomitus squalens]|nr:hypothetical protein BD309DRAFT_958321 [Dichomitus squalens]